MPFIRLSDNYIDHPKFLALSASAFRLWHEGMAFCRKHQTDGLIPMNTLQGFRYYQPVRVKELAAPYQAQANPLWETIAGFGYKVHDYLFWNLSKEEEDAEKDGATTRMRALRKRRRNDRLLQASDAACSPEQVTERSPNVRDRIGSEKEIKILEKGSGEKPRQGPGAMVGMLPRDHLRHEACGRVCLQDTQFQEFVRLFGGEPEQAATAVRRWATDVLAAWDQPPKLSQPIGGNRFQFWQARWTEWHPAPVSAPASSGDDAMWAAIAKKGPSR